MWKCCRIHILNFEFYSPLRILFQWPRHSSLQYIDDVRMLSLRPREAIRYRKWQHPAAAVNRRGVLESSNSVYSDTLLTCSSSNGNRGWGLGENYCRRNCIQHYLIGAMVCSRTQEITLVVSSERRLEQGGLGSVGLQKPISGDAQRLGDLFHVVYRDISRLTLDMSDEGAMQSRLESKHFLGPILLITKSNDVSGQNGPRGRINTSNGGRRYRHRLQSHKMMLLSQPLLSHN